VLGQPHEAWLTAKAEVTAGVLELAAAGVEPVQVLAKRSAACLVEVEEGEQNARGRLGRGVRGHGDAQPVRGGDATADGLDRPVIAQGRRRLAET